MPQIEEKKDVKKTSCRKMGAGFLIILIILLFCAIGYLYYRFTLVDASVATAIADLHKSQDALHQEFQQQQSTVQGLDKNVQELRDSQAQNKQAVDNKQELAVTEAQYLVKLANDQLRITNNQAAAVSLLQTADQILQGLNDPKISDVRKALQSDMAAFQNVTKVDVDKIYSRLSSLNMQIEKLPLPQSAETKTTEDVQPEKTWWRQGLQQMLAALKQTVVIRHWQQDKLPFVMPEQKDFLYQNLHAMFEKAMWGLLHQQEDVYQASLQQIATWVGNYFLQDSADTKLFLNNIAELQKEKIASASPTISASIQAFQDYFKNRT